MRMAEWLSTNLFPSWFTEDLGVCQKCSRSLYTPDDVQIEKWERV